MIIRRATSADAAALAALARETFVDAFGADNRPEDMEAYTRAEFGEAQQRREIEDPDIVTLLGEIDEALIAYAQIRRSAGVPPATVGRLARSHWPPGETPGGCGRDGRHSIGEVELARFYVHRSHHGRGLAQQLMDAVIEYARALGAGGLWLGVWERNARAIAFYRKCGFVEVGAQPFLLGNDLQRDLVMQRTNL